LMALNGQGLKPAPNPANVAKIKPIITVMLIWF
jgi:hypothetical protein